MGTPGASVGCAGRGSVDHIQPALPLSLIERAASRRWRVESRWAGRIPARKGAGRSSHQWYGIVAPAAEASVADWSAVLPRCVQPR